MQLFFCKCSCFLVLVCVASDGARTRSLHLIRVAL